MRKILFARLKVKEQEQIVAGTIRIAGAAGTALASATMPNADSRCHTTITSKCIDDPPPDEPEYSLGSLTTGYSINPISKKT